jgi:hypothetical protein
MRISFPASGGPAVRYLAWVSFAAVFNSTIQSIGS